MKPKTWNSNKIEYGIVKTYQPWIIFYSWYCIRRPISLCHIVLLDVDFWSHSIQALLSPFAYLVQVVWITTTRFSSHSTLVCTLKRIDPTPHAVMPRSSRMWLKANLISEGLKTLDVSRKIVWSLSCSKFACFLALAIT